MINERNAALKNRLAILQKRRPHSVRNRRYALEKWKKLAILVAERSTFLEQRPHQLLRELLFGELAANAIRKRADRIVEDEKIFGLNDAYFCDAHSIDAAHAYKPGSD